MLNVSPCAKRFETCSVSERNVDSPIDCTWLMWLKRGSSRVAAFTAVL